MADEQEQAGKRAGFVSTVAKRALAPIVASAMTAITAFLMRKAAEIWEQQRQPKIEEKGGGRAVVGETPESSADKTSGEVTAPAEKPKPEDEGTDDAAREDERRRREQRRKQRRKALEQTRSS
jgi:hypothetical protein